MNLQPKRLIFQGIALIAANLGAFGLKTGFCYPFFYCHACPAATSACPLRAIEQSVFKGSITWRFLLYPILILGFFGALTGRAICGWACPIGLLQRATSRVPRRLKKYRFIRNLGTHPIEPYLRYIKYLLLIGLVVVTPYVIGFMFTDICPVGFLTGTIPILALNPGKFVPNIFFPVAAIIFVLFLILIFIIERGWCRYCCPIGAFLAPFNKISVLHVAVNKEKCKHCNVCSYICPMGIDVPNMDRDPECIICGKCISECPEQIIAFER